MSLNDFGRLPLVRASTLRNPPASGGKVGDPITQLQELLILPWMPVTPEILEMYEINSPREGFVTYTPGQPDLAEGDLIVMDETNIKYRIEGLGSWPSKNSFFEIIGSLVKGT